MKHSSETPSSQADNQIDAAYRARRNLFLALIAAIIVFEGVLAFGLFRPDRPLPPITFVKPMSGLNATPKCPDDFVEARFDLTVQGPAVLEIDNGVRQPLTGQSTWASRERRVIVPAPLDVVVNQRWRIPPEFVNAATGDVSGWEPGYYELMIALTTASRDSVPTIITFPFLIGECP